MTQNAERPAKWLHRAGEARPAAYRFCATVLRPILMRTTRRDWQGVENIPTSGPCVVVVNHLSDMDFAMVAHVVHDRGRYVRFLAKSNLFTIPLVGKLITSAGMIPVYRGSSRAADALRDAIKAVRQGQLVVIYPEGTITGDPDLWPMKGKTGAARVALETGCPVVPMVTWGPQDILRRGVKGVHLLPRKTIRALVGPPLDLSRYAGQPQSPQVLHEITDEIMETLARLLGQVRGEQPPPTRYDPVHRTGGSVGEDADVRSGDRTDGKGAVSDG